MAKCINDVVEVRSSRVEFKQAMFGWADDNRFGALYGHPVGPNRGDRTTWAWSIPAHTARQAALSMEYRLPELRGAERRATLSVIKALGACRR